MNDVMLEPWRNREPNLEVTGIGMGGEDAIRWLEYLKEEIMTGNTNEETYRREMTERALNRLRYLVSCQTPHKPTFHKGKYSRLHDYYTCGNCGAGLEARIGGFCRKCGHRIKEEW